MPLDWQYLASSRTELLSPAWKSCVFVSPLKTISVFSPVAEYMCVFQWCSLQHYNVIAKGSKCKLLTSWERERVVNAVYSFTSCHYWFGLYKVDILFPWSFSKYFFDLNAVEKLYILSNIHIFWGCGCKNGNVKDPSFLWKSSFQCHFVPVGKLTRRTKKRPNQQPLLHLTTWKF